MMMQMFRRCLRFPHRSDCENSFRLGTTSNVVSRRSSILPHTHQLSLRYLKDSPPTPHSGGKRRPIPHDEASHSRTRSSLVDVVLCGTCSRGVTLAKGTYMILRATPQDRMVLSLCRCLCVSTRLVQSTEYRQVQQGRDNNTLCPSQGLNRSVRNFPSF